MGKAKEGVGGKIFPPLTAEEFTLCVQLLYGKGLLTSVVSPHFSNKIFELPGKNVTTPLSRYSYSGPTNI